MTENQIHIKKKYLNKIIFAIGLAMLFFLQETEKYNALIVALSVLLLLMSIIFKQPIRFRLPAYFAAAFLVYAVFVVEGLLYHHVKPTIDIKFQFFIFFLFLIFINRPQFNYIRFFVWVNFLTLLIYLLLYFHVIPSFWSDNIVGYRGKLMGPALIGFIFIAFDYLYQNKPVDKTLIAAFSFSLIYVLLAANFMNLLIILGLMFLILVDLKKVFSPKIIGLTGVLFLLFVAFVNSSYVPILVQKKLQYVSKPWEYPSFKIRIEDLKKAIKTEKYTPREFITGKGFGAGTTIYRENKKVQAFSRWFHFQEIDNGFYYVFHRGGLILLLGFIVLNTLFLLVMPNLKSRLAFFLIVTVTNLLSIHYFNYYFYVFLYFYILNSPYSKKMVFKYRKKLNFQNEAS